MASLRFTSKLRCGLLWPGSGIISDVQQIQLSGQSDCFYRLTGLLQKFPIKMLAKSSIPNRV